MKKLIIETKTPAGERALSQHIKETKKLSLKQKLIFKAAGFKQEVTSQDPLTLELNFRGKHENNPHYLEMLKTEIKDAMSLNGAKEGQDYTIKKGLPEVPK